MRDHIQHATIIDTGSADDTIAVARREFADLPHQILEQPWIDFGTNRTQALAAARDTADYLLILDADLHACRTKPRAPDTRNHAREGRRRNMESRKPTPKVAAGGTAGAASIVLVYTLGQLGIDVPAEVASALTVLIAFAASYMKRDA